MSLFMLMHMGIVPPPFSQEKKASFRTSKGTVSIEATPHGYRIAHPDGTTDFASLHCTNSVEESFRLALREITKKYGEIEWC